MEGIELVSIPMPKNSPVMAFEGEDGKFQVHNQPVPSGDGTVTGEQADSIVDAMLGSAT